MSYALRIVALVAALLAFRYSLRGAGTVLLAFQENLTTAGMIVFLAINLGYLIGAFFCAGIAFNLDWSSNRWLLASSVIILIASVVQAILSYLEPAGFLNDVVGALEFHGRVLPWIGIFIGVFLVLVTASRGSHNRDL